VKKGPYQQASPVPKEESDGKRAGVPKDPALA
jgi:hypothetical protein